MTTTAQIVESKEGHVFCVYFFTQQLSKTEFTFHEYYLLIKDGKVYELGFDKISKTGDDALTVILNGEDIGLYDESEDYSLKLYDLDVSKLKKMLTCRKEQK